MNIDFLSFPAACGNNAFHPSVAVLSENHYIMSFQRIFSSDCYGACEFCESFDGGINWSEARNVPGFESKVIAGNNIVNSFAMTAGAIVCGILMKSGLGCGAIFAGISAVILLTAIGTCKLIKNNP